MTARVRRQPLTDFEGVVPLLHGIPIFGGLSESQLREIFKRLQRVSYREGEVIFKEGDCASYIYIVEQGRVKLVFDEHGVYLTKAELEPGMCFGETSVIGIQPHSATTIAMEDCELLILSGETLGELFETDKALFSILILNIARESCRRLYKTNKQLVELLSENTDSGVPDIQGY
ncbi:MAG: cyclic nucleotide-binding domain-containing protein [Pseudomonadota bacterium]